MIIKLDKVIILEYYKYCSNKPLLLGGTEMSKEITNRITALLSRLNMSQKELSVATGITESAISHYVKGDRVPRGVNLMKIAKALDTTVDYLLGNAEDDREKDLKEAKTLIARNASKMTKEEKMELVSILLSE